jgi:short-subunit dehydrogenase
MATVFMVGASKGIGLATRQSLIQQGHTVIGTSRQPIDGDLLALDINDEASIQRCMDMLATTSIDVLIYNAGYDLYSAAEDTTLADVRAQLETNFFGAVRMIQAVLPKMRRQGHGKIILLSSLGGRMALPFNSAYAASKFALEGYAESLRYELLPHNIFVTLVEPGQVKTDTLVTSIRSVNEPSAYGVPSAKLAQRARDEGEKATLTPEAVAQTILQLVERKAPPLRQLVGSQARMVVMMQQFMPVRLFERFIVRQFVTPLLKSS